MERTPDKPPGTEKHPPNIDPGRGGGGEPDESREEDRPQREPPPEASPGEEGVPQPRR